MSASAERGLCRRFRNLTGVPSAHYDPIFARAVRSAVRRQRPDIIALELPDSIDAELGWVASCWPAPVAIGRTWGDSADDVQLIPFVPGDSMLEGLVLAQELGIRRQCIDLDASGRVTRPAIHLPGPELAPAVGGAYLNVLDAIVEGHGGPLVVDDAREAHMARCLAALMAEHRHVLWIGGAAHWTRIVGRIERGNFDAAAVAMEASTARMRLQLSPEALHHITGRIPYLSARYAARPAHYAEAAAIRSMAVEAARHRQETIDGEGSVGLLDAGLHEFDRPEPERAAAIDIARMLVYARNLAATGRLGERPTLGELIGAARAVIGRAYAAHLYLTAMEGPISDAARGYPALEWMFGETSTDFAIDGRRVRVWSRTSTPSPDDPILMWFRRAPRRLRAVPAYADLPAKNEGEKLGWFVHPVEEHDYEEYVRYVLGLASHTEAGDTKAVPFAVGMGDGIDIRETIRHWKDDTVYVREAERGQLRITNGLIDYSSRRERSAVHSRQDDGAGPAWWVDPDLRRVGSASRELRFDTLQDEPCHVSLRHRELSFISLDRFNSVRIGDHAHSMWKAVIDPLVNLKGARDNLYEWLDVVFAACAGKPFAYFSRYVPSARIHALARRHRVRLIHKPLALIPKPLRERNRRFRFMSMSKSQWEAFQARLAEQKLAWGDTSAPAGELPFEELSRKPAQQHHNRS